MHTHTANILRLDNITVEDFINAVNLTMESTSPKVLLPDRKLHDIRIRFTRNSVSEMQNTEQQKRVYQMYLVVEEELMNRTRDRYIAFVADASEENNLVALAFQIRDLLSERKIRSHFRIDPQHGLVMGSPKNTISPFYGDPKPQVCIALYLVSDISHPGIATYEYVDRRYRREFIKVFKRVNGQIPKRMLRKFYKDVLSIGRKKESFILRHRDVVAILKCLETNHFQDIVLSILYESLSSYELDNLAFETIAGSFLFSGQGKFFNKLEDLLAPMNYDAHLKPD